MLQAKDIKQKTTVKINVIVFMIKSFNWLYLLYVYYAQRLQK